MRTLFKSRLGEWGVSNEPVAGDRIWLAMGSAPNRTVAQPKLQERVERRAGILSDFAILVAKRLQLSQYAFIGLRGPGI